MRIGEVAELLGVTTRTLRHYHRAGVVPEPARQDNGYRDYGLRDVVLLMRAVRLAGLGLSLAEVADAMRDDDVRDLADILGDLDDELGRQEREIRARRDTIRSLRIRIESATEDSSAHDAFLPDEAQALFTSLQAHGAGTQSLEIDRQIMSTLPDGAVHAWATAMTDGGTDSTASERIADIYRRFDDLGHGDAATRTEDPALRQLARDLLAALPESLRQQFLEAPDSPPPILDALVGDLSPAQAATIRHLLALKKSP